MPFWAVYWSVLLFFTLTSSRWHVPSSMEGRSNTDLSLLGRSDLLPIRGVSAGFLAWYSVIFSNWLLFRASITQNGNVHQGQQRAIWAPVPSQALDHTLHSHNRSHTACLKSAAQGAVGHVAQEQHWVSHQLQSKSGPVLNRHWSPTLDNNELNLSSVWLAGV